MVDRLKQDSQVSSIKTDATLTRSWILECHQVVDFSYGFWVPSLTDSHGAVKIDPIYYYQMGWFMMVHDGSKTIESLPSLCVSKHLFWHKTNNYSPKQPTPRGHRVPPMNSPLQQSTAAAPALQGRTWSTTGDRRNDSGAAARRC